MINHKHLLAAVCALWLATAGGQRSRGDILTEGDAFFDGAINVATQSGNGSLTVTPGPVVNASSGIITATEPPWIGTVNIDGGHYQLGGGNLDIGLVGTGILQIINGGRLGKDPESSGQQINLIVAAQETAQGTVLISGPGSILDSPEGNAVIGVDGLASFTIEDGGRANHGQVGIGAANNSATPGLGTALVTGEQSRWDIQRGLFLGSGGGSGDLRIEQGAQVRSGLSEPIPEAVVGGEGSTGELIVDGAGSLWRHLNQVEVGRGGTGSLHIQNGGSAVVQALTVGGENSIEFASAGLVTVDGQGSLLSTSGLELAPNGNGQILLSDGGKLINNAQTVDNRLAIGRFRGSYGRLVVDGATTQWVDHSEVVDIGPSGRGEVVIQNGAVVSNPHVRLGIAGGQGEVMVTGPGSTWNVGTLSIGAEGASKVTIADGAILNRTGQGLNDLAIGTAGELVLDNGAVVGNLDTQPIRNTGTIRGTGEIHVSIINGGGNPNFTSRIQVGNAERLVLTRALENLPNGRVSVFGGELDVRESLSNRDGGVIALDSANLTVGSNRFSGVALENEGTLLSVAGSNHLFGDLHNTESGEITLSGNSQTTFYDEIQNNGTINVSTGSVATFFGAVAGNGVGGGGTVFLEGPIAPGFSPGTMEFGGDVVLGQFSELNIEVDADANDRLEIAGDAVLGGDLVLTALAALDGPTSIEILSAESIDGVFHSVPEVGESLGFGVVFDGIAYSEDSVVVSLLQQDADFNGDGVVDFLDLGLWTIGYPTQTGASLINGDASLDGDTDGQDFLLWQQQREPTATGIAASQTVPEPSAAALVAMLAATLPCTRRRP